MARPTMPEKLKKVSIHITVDREVAEEAKRSGNASRWFEEAGKEKISNQEETMLKRAS